MGLWLKGNQYYQIWTYYISLSKKFKTACLQKKYILKVIILKIRFKTNLLNMMKCLYLYMNVYGTYQSEEQAKTT